MLGNILYSGFELLDLTAVIFFAVFCQLVSFSLISVLESIHCRATVVCGPLILELLRRMSTEVTESVKFTALLRTTYFGGYLGSSINFSTGYYQAKKVIGCLM